MAKIETHEELWKDSGTVHLFHCPGCNGNHFFDSRWTYNEDPNRPTFSPSLLVSLGHHPDPPHICHSFVRDGKIEYLTDSTHDLAGQTVEIPEWED